MAMQSLDIISVNLWQILISLINLLLLFLILKKFLFKPVQKVLKARQEELDAQYAAAEEAEQSAYAHRTEWETKLSGADREANAILQKATETAQYRGDQMIADAKARADGIVRSAEEEARLERQKATADIKREIVDVSGALAEKMLEREINQDDHRALIDAFTQEIGDGND